MDRMKKIVLFLEWGSILGLLGCGLWVFLWTPLEISQGFPQKIMYLHVPTVIIAYLAFLVTTLLLFLIFMGYFLLRMSINDRDKEARLAAVLGIIGCLDIPIIHKSIEWAKGRTLHQPSTFFKVETGEINPSISDVLSDPLPVAIFFMLTLYLYLLLLRYQIEKHQDELYQLLAETQD